MITPVGHRVLLEVKEAELETEWGFEIVSDKKLEDAAMTEGVLVAMGDQAWKAFGPEFSGKPWAKIGDRVYFSRYSGNVITDPDTEKQYKIMNDEDIIAVVSTKDND